MRSKPWHCVPGFSPMTLCPRAQGTNPATQ